MKISKNMLGVVGLPMLIVLATTGCATKKYVRQQVEPVNTRVGEVDKKSTEAVANLGEKTSKDISRVEERAMTADNHAAEAAKAAQAADQRAGQANQLAQTAQQLAQQNETKLNDVSRMVDNVDKYRLVTTEDVLFGFNKATLTPDAKGKLDQFVQQINSNPAGASRIVLEVEGFTDKTGPRDYNLALSRRRADTVVRYLVSHNVPLRRIHMIGLGSEQMPMEAQATAGNAGQAMGTESTTGTRHMSRREMRKQERRVVVRMYAPENTLAAGNTGMGTTGTQQPSTRPAPQQ